MTEDSESDFDLRALRSRLKAAKEKQESERKTEFPAFEDDEGNISWNAVSRFTGVSINNDRDNFLSSAIDFVGKNLEGGKLAGENLENANFSVANLTKVDFSGANLRGADLSGANLTGANLEGADLSGAVLNSCVLKDANFTGAILKGIKISEADIEGAILLDISIDEMGIEELQALIEYLAKYYPHKLNLNKLNLTLLDLSKIDLKHVSLRGVDFTGVDFTGVNIIGLDLSECNITPQQIAQALGRVPSPAEMKMLLAPKTKKGKEFSGIDMTDLFLGSKDYGVWDTTKAKGWDVGKILEAGKKVFRKSAEKPPVKDDKALEYIKEEREKEAKSHNEELKMIIEERKRKELAARASMKQELQGEVEKEALQKESGSNDRNGNKSRDIHIEQIRSARDRGRD